MMRRMLIATVLLTLLGAASLATANLRPQSAGPMAYVTVPVDLADLEKGAIFGTLNLATGQFTRIGATEFLIGVARSKGSIYGIDAKSNLVAIDTATARTRVIGNVGITTRPGPFGLAVDVFTSMNDRLYLMDYDNNLFSVDAATGKASLIGATGIRPLKEFFLATSLAGDGSNLYFTVHEVSRANLKVVTPPMIYRINPKTAKATRVGPTADFVFGTVYAGKRLYGFSILDRDNPTVRKTSQENRATTKRRTQIVTLNTTTAGLSKSQSFRVVRVIDEDIFGGGGPHGILSGIEAVINPAGRNQ